MSTATRLERTCKRSEAKIRKMAKTIEAQQKAIVELREDRARLVHVLQKLGYNVMSTKRGLRIETR